jgi:hypothetical protein
MKHCEGSPCTIKALWTRNVWQMEKFRSKLVFYIVFHKSSSFDKHIKSRKLYITDALCFYSTGTLLTTLHILHNLQIDSIS